MNILLLAPYVGMSVTIMTTQYPPLGLLYLGATVIDLADRIQILDANVLQLDVEETCRRVEEFDPDIIGISINISNSSISKEIVSNLRGKMPRTKFVAGGPSPTTHPYEWIGLFDVTICGEGELAFKYVVEQYRDYGKITGSYTGVNTADSPITIAPQLTNLDEPYILPYHILVPHLHYYTKKARIVKPYMAPILTSRGCPYNCSFCDRSVHGTRFRPRSPESVLREIKWLYDEYDVRQLDILDDNFTFDLERAELILDGIMEIGQFAINCQSGLRADRINQRLVKKMKKAGVFKVGIGIESANEVTLQKINKKLDLEDVKIATDLFRKERITVHGFFIVGLPNENLDDVSRTIEYAIKLNPHFANFSKYLPIMGTQLYNELLDDDLVNHGIGSSFYYQGSPIKSSKMNEIELRNIFHRAYIKFYLRPYKIIDIIVNAKSIKELLWVIRLGISVLKNT